MSYKVALIGARGYVGHELIDIVSGHPSFELVVASSRELEGQHIAGYKKKDLKYQLIDKTEASKLNADLVFLALPNGLSKQYVEAITDHEPSTIIIDLSGDHRFDDGWVYSLPEVYSFPEVSSLTKEPQSIVTNDAEKKVNLISNPGCYATAIQLSLAPLKPYIKDKVSCFGVSGYSGAGTKPSDKNNTEKLKDNLMPYQLTEHLHENEVSKHLGLNIKFSPHVAEFFRGINLTSHVSLDTPLTEADLFRIFNQFYENDALVDIQKEPPLVKAIAGSHKAVIGGFSLSKDGKHVALNCVIDNLLKGAATQAIQNANLAFSLPLMTGITMEESAHG